MTNHDEKLEVIYIAMAEFCCLLCQHFPHSCHNIVLLPIYPPCSLPMPWLLINMDILKDGSTIIGIWESSTPFFFVFPS